MREGDATLAMILSYIIPVVEACGALVVILGVGRAIVAYVRSFLSHGRVPVARLRVQLGQRMMSSSWRSSSASGRCSTFCSTGRWLT